MATPPSLKIGLSHLNDDGTMHMVNVGDKAETPRMARACALLKLGEASLFALGQNPKGDIFAAARLAGIQAAKRTGDLIPLCHPLPLTHVAVDIVLEGDMLNIETRAETVGRTGVEMEAMTAASIAALTIYDMLKAADRALAIESVVLLEKRGGKSGHWQRPIE